MTDRATAYSVPPQSTGTDLAVRPKVLRRPAHFGSKPIETPAPVLIPLNAAPYVEQPLKPATRAWQDDGKFAITLLAFVIIVNLVVSAWLAAISPNQPSPAPSSTVESAPAHTPVHVLDSNARAISEQ